MNTTPHQLLFEIPERTKGWPMPWFASPPEGYRDINAGRIRAGDYVFTDGGDINDIEYTKVFDEDGKPTEYIEGKKYAVYDRVVEMGDCWGDFASDYTSVFRPRT